LSAFVLNSNELDEASLKSIREWMKNFPITEGNVNAVIRVYKITGDPADLEPLRSLLVKGDDRFKTYLLSELVHLDIQEFIELSLDHLAPRRLYKGWSSRKSVGNLILELLKVRHNDERVLLYARQWLRIRPNDYEHSVYKQIAEIVETAGHQGES